TLVPRDGPRREAAVLTHPRAEHGDQRRHRRRRGRADPEDSGVPQVREELAGRYAGGLEPPLVGGVALARLEVLGEVGEDSLVELRNIQVARGRPGPQVLD